MFHLRSAPAGNTVKLRYWALCLCLPVFLGGCGLTASQRARVELRGGDATGTLTVAIDGNEATTSSAHRTNEVLNRIKDGLQDLSVSRPTLNWGIPVPTDGNHVIYVWIDALVNYLSGIGFPEEVYTRYWPAQAHVIGKDIMWFHAVIWPCILMAMDVELPEHIYVHGFWHSGGDNILTGDYVGKEAVLGYFGMLMQETGGSFKNDIHDMLANDEHGVALVTAKATRGGKSLETHVVHIFHMHGGKMTEFWSIAEDQGVFDDFWS